MKITQKTIESIALPRAGQVLIRDGDLPGFGVRATSGGVSYIVEARVNGKSKRITVGRSDLLSAEDARAKAIKLLAAMTTGTDPVAEKRKEREACITLGEVLDQYLSVRRLRPNTIKAYRNVLKQRLGDWLNLPITSISRAMVEERHRFISTDGGEWKASGVQGNQAMRILRTLFNFANDRYQRAGQNLILANPVAVLSQDKQWHKEYPRQTVISDHQMNDWYKAVQSLRNSTARDALMLMIMTGLRFRECVTLRWLDVDFAERSLRIRAEISKNGRENKLPLSEFVFDLLKKRKEQSQSSLWVFPGRLGPIRKFDECIFAVRKKSQVYFSPHDLRRTFLTHCERQGVPHNLIKRIANHSTGRDITSQYLIVNLERLREPMEQVSRRLLKLMHKEQTVREALEAYLLGRQVQARTRTMYRNTLAQRAPEWLDLPLASISLAMMKEKHRQISTEDIGEHKASRAQADVTMRVLKLLLRWKGLPAPVVNGIPRRQKNRKIIPTKSLPALYAAIMSLKSDAVRDYLIVVLFLGLTRRQALSLKWNDVDLQAETLKVPGKCLPLCPFLSEVMKKRFAARKSEFVFDGRSGQLKKPDHSTALVSAKTGLHFNVHDIRRTFERMARQLGYSRYATNKMKTEELREVMNKVSMRLLKICR